MDANGDPSVDLGAPPRQYIAAELVVDTMARFGARRIETLSVVQIIMLGGLGGALITSGALFSILLAVGVESPGVARLVEGFGFSAGFFFVIVTEAVLFTEANVVLPATLLGGQTGKLARRVVRFWVLAAVGNLIGALIVGWGIHLAQHYPPDVVEQLSDVVARKMSWREIGEWAHGVRSSSRESLPTGSSALLPSSLSWGGRSSASTFRCCSP